MDQRIDFDLLRERRAEIGAARTSIQPWRRGGRPQARFMPRIARVLNISLAGVVRALWNENLGQFCPCGCGGKKVFPEKFPTARKLVIESLCAGCGKKRIFSQQGDHRKFCLSCAHAGESAHLATTLRRLSISKGRFYPWLRGELRPPQEILLVMMRIFRRHGMSEAETMRRFWGENIGDPCLCGCGGKKILSDDPNARTLAPSLSDFLDVRPELRIHRGFIFVEQFGSLFATSDFSFVKRFYSLFHQSEKTARGSASGRLIDSRGSIKYQVRFSRLP